MRSVNLFKPIKVFNAIPNLLRNLFKSLSSSKIFQNVDTRKKTDGFGRSHIRGAIQTAVSCTSPRYIKGDSKFGRVGFSGFFVVGYSVMHFVGRRAEK